MARARLLKPDFFSNEAVCRCPLGARLLFLGLWVEADNHGRLRDRPAVIWGHVFPYEVARKRWVPIWLDQLASEGLIERSDGYIQVTNWYAWQGPDKHPVRKAWDLLRSAVAPQVIERDGAWCASCGATERLTIDHRIAIANGGTNDLTNLQVLCRQCNSRKSAS